VGKVIPQNIGGEIGFDGVNDASNCASWFPETHVKNSDKTITGESNYALAA